MWKGALVSAIPRKGDIVEFDFSPSRGHEPRGRRPGLVVSSDEFNWRTSMALVCPVTTANTGFPLHVRLPEGLDEAWGFVVTEQVRAYDLLARNPQVVAHLDSDGPFMNNITTLLRSYL